MEILLCCCVSVYLAFPFLSFHHTEELKKSQFPQWRSCPTSAGQALFALDVFSCTKVLDPGREGTCFVLFLLTESTVLRPVIRLAELVRSECQEQCIGQRKTNSRKLENVLCFLREKLPPDATKRSQERVVLELWSELEQCLVECLSRQGNEKDWNTPS